MDFKIMYLISREKYDLLNKTIGDCHINPSSSHLAGQDSITPEGNNRGIEKGVPSNSESKKQTTIDQFYPKCGETKLNKNPVFPEKNSQSSNVRKIKQAFDSLHQLEAGRSHERQAGKTIGKRGRDEQQIISHNPKFDQNKSLGKTRGNRKRSRNEELDDIPSSKKKRIELKTIKTPLKFSQKSLVKSRNKKSKP